MNNDHMKKVGTLTFHIAHNYGAMLQAYALPKAVESLGYKCEIIHYCFSHIYRWGHIQYLPELCKKHGIVGGSLRFAKKLIKGVYNPNGKQQRFERFIYETMQLSESAYYSAQELNGMDYDAILFGSDQIWNSQITGGIAKEFAGGFDCLEKTKKIAYAASCGRNTFNEEEKEQYYPQIKSFHALGIREQGFCQSLCDDGFPARQVLDPTLLLTKEQWLSMTQSGRKKTVLPKKDYLLIYVFEEDPSVYKLVDKVAEKYGLEVCCIAYQMKDEIKKYRVFQNCGPKEFVELIAGASRVVTTSFHGTVFSILFEKEFYCVPHPTLHERTDSLLELLDLGDRNCSPDTKIDEMSDVNWENVKNKLDVLRTESLQFIQESIE